MLERSFPSTSDAPALARDALEPLAEDVPEAVMLDLRLLVSELVTNAVRHAITRPDSSVGLRVERLDGHVRVEVRDEGRGFDAAQEPAPKDDSEGGWGLYMLDKVADRWGTRPCVWFEMTA